MIWPEQGGRLLERERFTVRQLLADTERRAEAERRLGCAQHGVEGVGVRR